MLHLDDKFSFCLGHIFEIEGGFVNHPNDKGGATNYGITQKTLSGFRGYQVSIDDVKNLTKDEAGKIYHREYWIPAQLSHVKDPFLACILMDQAVNRGVPAMAKTLQKTLNDEFKFSLVVDGILGSRSQQAIAQCDVNMLAIQFIKETQKFYLELIKRDSTQAVFLNGWLARTWKLLDLLC